MSYFFVDNTAKSKGTIINNVSITVGLKSQYSNPKENINIQNSFEFKNFIKSLLN